MSTQRRVSAFSASLCVHIPTGRVCVPFDPKEVDDFDPFEVPTLGSLVKEVDDFDERYPEKKKTVPGSKQLTIRSSHFASSVIEKTTMCKYLNLWDRVFLKPLYAEIRNEFRQLNDGSSLQFSTTYTLLSRTYSTKRRLYVIKTKLLYNIVATKLNSYNDNKVRRISLFNNSFTAQRLSSFYFFLTLANFYKIQS